MLRRGAARLFPKARGATPATSVVLFLLGGAGGGGRLIHISGPPGRLRNLGVDRGWTRCVKGENCWVSPLSASSLAKAARAARVGGTFRMS